jgi:sulfopyruvate decarboxylase TPP-binding subunit
MNPLPVPNPPGGPSASAMLAQLQAAGVTHAVTVPDWVQFALHERLVDPASGIRNVFTTTEDQALTAATGLHVGGARPVVLVQNQGFYKCINTLRATCIDAGVPIVFLVGQFGREAENIGQPMTESRRSIVSLLEPLADAMGIRHWTVDEDADVPRIGEAFAHAKSAETAAVVIVGRHVAWK